MYKKTDAISFSARCYDMQEQKDLTEMARSAVTQKKFIPQLPFKNAIKIVKGNGGKGKREFALFSDPDLSVLSSLEETLAGMTDYTAYVFMFLIKSLHPDAISKAERIWCSKDREKAWNNYMLMDKEPAAGNCKKPCIRKLLHSQSSLKFAVLQA